MFKDSFYLKYSNNYNWSFFLEFIDLRKIELIESINSDNSYSRSFLINNTIGVMTIRNEKNGFFITATMEKIIDRQCLIDYISFFLGLHEANTDSFFLKITSDFDIIPNLHIPKCCSIFEAAVRAICGQLISIKSATTMLTKIVKNANIRTEEGFYVFPSEEVFLKLYNDKINISNKKYGCIADAAKLLLNGGEVKDLISIKGIGAWTVNYVLLRATNNSDIFLLGDLGIKQAQEKFKNLNPIEFSPYRSYLNFHLWHSL